MTLAKVDYDAEVKHDGKLHSFTVPELLMPACEECGAKVFTEDVDDQINDALRVHLGLLTPIQLRESLERIGLSQKALAEHLGLAEATVSRWAGGSQIQSRSMDRLLRIFFAFPDVRQAVTEKTVEPYQLGLHDMGTTPKIITTTRSTSLKFRSTSFGGGNWNGAIERCSLAQNYIRVHGTGWSDNTG